MIDKGVCSKGFIWNPSNCKCECDKSWNIGGYLDCELFKCRKELVDQLVEECTENIDEKRVTGIALFERWNDCKSSCTTHVVLIAIVFIISIGISTYFNYYKHINHHKKTASKCDYVYQASNY